MKPGRLLAAASLLAACDAPAPGSGALPGGDGGGSGSTSAPCPDPSACDDGLPCTVDACAMPGEVCSWTLAAGTCLAGGACRVPGEAKAGSPCLACVPGADPHAWTPLPSGVPCDDADPCTTGDGCQAGLCVAAAATCDDGEPCTDDPCDGGACEHHLVPEGGPCDDGDACTAADSCKVGSCAGVPLSCDDGEPCTKDSCDAGIGCVSTASSDACDDGDPCTIGDACAGGSCVPGAAGCDDGNGCTIDDCSSVAGCVHLPVQSPCCTGQKSKCDDGDPCTSDACDPLTAACSHAFAPGPCDDGDPCTGPDACSEAGLCQGKALSCDDGEPCTDDYCAAGAGCLHAPKHGGPCDDGLPCSTADSCVQGACEGDVSGCTCEPDLSGGAVKLVVVAIGEGGYPGQGLDVDGDAGTCAPEGDCSGGVDNSLGTVASIVNDPLQGAVDKGSLVLVLQLRDLGGPSPLLAVYQAKLAPSGAGCDGASETCPWLVSPKFLDPETCEPEVALPAVISGNHVSAGSPTSSLPFSLSIGGADLDIVIEGVRLEADLAFGSGIPVVGLEGLLGGGVPQESILAAVDALDPSKLPPPFTKELVKSFVETLEVDLDADGDGKDESISIGLRVEAVGALLVGVQPP